MQVQNNKEEVPFAHYEEKFASLDPQEAAARCGVPFENGRFTVTLLGTAYQIAWPEYAISSPDEAAFALKSLPCQTFLLRFLLEGRAAEPSGGYKTFREMPWGEPPRRDRARGTAPHSGRTGPLLCCSECRFCSALPSYHSCTLDGNSSRLVWGRKHAATNSSMYRGFVESSIYVIFAASS